MQEGTSAEAEIETWMRQFDLLPADRQENLRKWFWTQKIIIENLGLETEEWFGYLQWALENPLDYSFVEDFPDNEALAALERDETSRVDETVQARDFVGLRTKKTAVADGPAMKDKIHAKDRLDQELFQRFMKNHLGPRKK